MSTPTAEQFAILRHTTGDNGGSRNYYCAPDGDPQCEALVSGGWFERGGTINAGQIRYYRATPAGIRQVSGLLVREREAAGLRWWRCGGVVAGKEWSTVVAAKTRSGARYLAALPLMDVLDFKSAIQCVGYVRVSR